MKTVAVVGTGIAGMSCAYRLYKHVDLTLYESAHEPGGHTHTVDLQEGGRPIPVDTGFMVYNETTYPLLTQLFAELDVETIPTDMSFGVQYRPHGIEFCGSSLRQLFARRRNGLSPRFYRMLVDIVRFNRIATDSLSDPRILEQDLADFVKSHHFGRSFLDYYLVPMTSAIWSTPPDEMMRFPAQTLIRFMYNHGLLGIRTQHQWRTVKGGSRSYRDKLIHPFKNRIQCGCPVVSVRRNENGVAVTDASGKTRIFDQVVMATHADTSLKLLVNPSERQERLLRCFPYSSNTITLHRDASVMPVRRAAWASWNYRVDSLSDGSRQASTHYWMNSLQKLDTPTDWFVSVNEPASVRRDLIAKEFTFDHPMFSREAAHAQLELPTLNDNGRLYFCGSYYRYGFHEDGILSGYGAAEKLLRHSALHEKLAI